MSENCVEEYRRLDQFTDDLLIKNKKGWVVSHILPSPVYPCGFIVVYVRTIEPIDLLSEILDNVGRCEDD